MNSKLPPPTSPISPTSPAAPVVALPAARTAKALKGYWSHGRFVKPEEIALEPVGAPSRTQLKAEADEKQALGEALVTLRADLLAKLDLPDKLRDAITDAKRITNFEGRRRQMQFIGKLMRPLDAAPVRAAIAEQAGGSAATTLSLHLAEQWRDRLIASDAALADWLDKHPGVAAGDGVQPLRALIRQARKDAAIDPDKPGAAPRHGKAFREIFQHVRRVMSEVQAEDDEDDEDDEAESDEAESSGDESA